MKETYRHVVSVTHFAVYSRYWVDGKLHNTSGPADTIYELDGPFSRYNYYIKGRKYKSVESSGGEVSVTWDYPGECPQSHLLSHIGVIGTVTGNTVPYLPSEAEQHAQHEERVARFRALYCSSAHTQGQYRIAHAVLQTQHDSNYFLRRHATLSMGYPSSPVFSLTT